MPGSSDRFGAHCEKCKRTTMWERVLRDGKPRMRCTGCGKERPSPS